MGRLRGAARSARASRLLNKRRTLRNGWQEDSTLYKPFECLVLCGPRYENYEHIFDFRRRLPRGYDVLREVSRRGTEFHVILCGASGDGVDGEGFADRILHAELASGPVVLMASDGMPGSPFVKGTNFSISLTCESQEEMERIFAALSESGQVTMPMGDVFWGGRFGMLTDRFGISWMLSFRD